MRTKRTTWVDKDRMVPLYGVQVLVRGKWINVSKANKPLLFATKEEADAERKVLRAALPSPPPGGGRMGERPYTEQELHEMDENPRKAAFYYSGLARYARLQAARIRGLKAKGFDTSGEGRDHWNKRALAAEASLAEKERRIGELVDRLHGVASGDDDIYEVIEAFRALTPDAGEGLMAKRNRPMRDKLAPVGRVIYWTGAARFYHNGDGAGFIWRWWHPLAWIAAPLGFVVSVVMVGLPETWRDKHALGFGMAPYFVKNPDKLEWAATRPPLSTTGRGSDDA